MNPYTGEIYESLADAKAAGVVDPVEVIGTPEAVAALSAHVRAGVQAKKKKARKAAASSRKANR